MVTIWSLPLILSFVDLAVVIQQGILHGEIENITPQLFDSNLTDKLWQPLGFLWTRKHPKLTLYARWLIARLTFWLQGQWLGSHSWETRDSKGWGPEASTKRPGFFSWSWPDFVLRSWANFCPKVWFCPRVSLHLTWPSQVSLVVRNLLANAGDVRVRCRFDLWVWKIP